MGYRSKLGWLRILVAGFLAEIALVVLVVPVYAWKGPEAAQPLLLWMAPPLCLLVMVPFGWWAARKAVSGHLWIGCLVGLVGVALYTVPMLLGGQELPWSFHLGNVLKVAGGALGGYIASRTAKPAAPTAAA